jgi:cbb3-type cytochrome oxidase maturation protein
MEIIYLLIGCSISIAGIFLLGFLWSIRSGQYDDTYTPSVRMLFDPGEVAPEPPLPEPAAETEEEAGGKSQQEA